jgi:hypothetical protein
VEVETDDHSPPSALYTSTTASPISAARIGSTPKTAEVTSAVPLRLMMISISDPNRAPTITTPTANRAPPKRSRTNSGIV